MQIYNCAIANGKKLFNNKYKFGPIKDIYLQGLWSIAL